MEALAVPILVSVVVGLMLAIVRSSAASSQALREEMQTHIASLRLDIKELLTQLARLQGALEERSALYALLSDRLPK